MGRMAWRLLTSWRAGSWHIGCLGFGSIGSANVRVEGRLLGGESFNIGEKIVAFNRVVMHCVLARQ